MSAKVIVTVLGKDQVGIVARIASVLAENGCNIEDISQTIMGDIFSMVMLVSVDEEAVGLKKLTEEFNKIGDEMGLQISAQHENVFKFMHRV